MNKTEAVRHLQRDEQFYSAFAVATNLPYVTCDEETFNDQVWVFSSEEEVKEFGRKCAEKKIALMGRIVKREQYLRFYGTLFSLGVNTVVYQNGAEKFEIDLGEIAQKKDHSGLPENQRPLENPTLQLSGVYFLQEMRKPGKLEEKTNIQELEEEFLVNLLKSVFLLAGELVEPEEGSKEAGAQPQIRIPYLKDKNNKILQPVFSDQMELEKFLQVRKIQKCRVMRVPFSDLGKATMKMAEGIVINPLGFNLPLTNDQLSKLLPEETPEEK